MGRYVVCSMIRARGLFLTLDDGLVERGDCRRVQVKETLEAYD